MHPRAHEYLMSLLSQKVSVVHIRWVQRTLKDKDLPKKEKNKGSRPRKLTEKEARMLRYNGLALLPVLSSLVLPQICQAARQQEVRPRAGR